MNGINKFEVPQKVFFFIYCFTLILMGATFMILLDATFQIPNDETATDQQKSGTLVLIALIFGTIFYLCVTISEALYKMRFVEKLT